MKDEHIISDKSDVKVINREFEKTVLVDKNGEWSDLNAEGEEITSDDGLLDFIDELWNQRCITDEVRDHLISTYKS